MTHASIAQTPHCAGYERQCDARAVATLHGVVLCGLCLDNYQHAGDRPVYFADPTNGGTPSPNDAPIPLPAEEPPTTPQTGGRASLDLPAAPAHTIDQTSDTLSGLETPTAAGREDAAPTIADLGTDEHGRDWHVIERHGGSMCIYYTLVGDAVHYVVSDSMDDRPGGHAVCDASGCQERVDIIALTGPDFDGNLYKVCAWHFGADIYSGDDSIILWRRSLPAPHRCPDCGDPVESHDQRCQACREDAAPVEIAPISWPTRETHCQHLAACATSSCPACDPAPSPPYACPSCETNAHRATQCPEVALVKYGMGVWEAYLEDKTAFLKLVQWLTAQRLALMGDAVAHYLSVRWGHTITGYQVLAGWRQTNAAPA